MIVIFSSFGFCAVGAETQRYVSFFENYKRLKKKVASPIPDVER
jgi:hypothetical protein